MGQEQLGFDPRDPISVEDWLAVPWQRLAEFTGGDVFHDGLGELGPARRRLRWYPADVWRYVLACQWTRIAQEESFPGRAGEVGDDLGSVLATGPDRPRPDAADVADAAALSAVHEMARQCLPPAVGLGRARRRPHRGAAGVDLAGP